MVNLRRSFPKSMNSINDLKEKPSVSILIPIRNEAAYIERCLDAVLHQDYSGEMECLVADGMSTDATRQIVQAYQQKYANLQMVDNPGKIVPTGLNRLIPLAKGDIIIRVDGHTILAPDYVRQCVETLHRSGADNVGGRMNAGGATLFGKTVALATSTPFGIGGGRFHYSEREEWVDTVYMGAWPRRVFEKLGLFDEELMRDQDDEFNYRLRAAGGKILLSPDIKSEYTVRSTPKGLWRQYFQYGFYKVRVLQKHPRQMSLRQFVPPMFVLSLLASALLAAFPAVRWFSLVVPTAYLAANLGASVFTALRVKKADRRPLSAHDLLLPLAFAILHLSYGLGFLLGLFKFWNRWGDKQGKVPAINFHD